MKYNKHQVVKHGSSEYVIGNSHTNNIEGFCCLFKRGVYGIYYQVCPKHLGRYCDEFAFRNTTHKEVEAARFKDALNQSNVGLTYDALTKDK